MIRKIILAALFGLLALTPATEPTSAGMTLLFAGSANTSSGSGGGSPLVPCSGAMTGQLDFSNPCNLIYYHQVMK